MIDWRDKFDSVVLASLEQIKPAVRNRGIICHAGTGGIYVRDVVITNKKDSWTKFKGKAHAIAAAYEPGWEASPHPDLSILHLGGEQKFEHPEPAVPTAMSAIYHQSPLLFSALGLRNVPESISQFRVRVIPRQTRAVAPPPVHQKDRRLQHERGMAGAW